VGWRQVQSQPDDQKPNVDDAAEEAGMTAMERLLHRLHKSECRVVLVRVYPTPATESSTRCMLVELKGPFIQPGTLTLPAAGGHVGHAVPHVPREGAHRHRHAALPDLHLRARPAPALPAAESAHRARAVRRRGEQQDWILMRRQGGRAHPLAACGVATLCCSPPRCWEPNPARGATTGASTSCH
jgi:hypothetical protein